MIEYIDLSSIVRSFFFALSMASLASQSSSSIHPLILMLVSVLENPSSVVVWNFHNFLLASLEKKMYFPNTNKSRTAKFRKKVIYFPTIATEDVRGRKQITLYVENAMMMKSFHLSLFLGNNATLAIY